MIIYIPSSKGLPADKLARSIKSVSPVSRLIVVHILKGLVRLVCRVDDWSEMAAVQLVGKKVRVLSRILQRSVACLGPTPTCC